MNPGSIPISPFPVIGIAFGSASIPLFTALTGAYMGAGPLSLSVTGAPAGVFTIATDANPVFANTQTLAYTPPVFSGLNVYVSFNPAAVTSYSATLVITGGGLGVPVNIPITGNGEIGIDPDLNIFLLCQREKK